MRARARGRAPRPVDRAPRRAPPSSSARASVPASVGRDAAAAGARTCRGCCPFRLLLCCRGGCIGVLSISLVVLSSCFYRLLGIVGLPLLHLYGLQRLPRAARDDQIHEFRSIFRRGFCCVRTRPTIRPLQLCVLVIFLSIGGSTGCGEPRRLASP